MNLVVDDQDELLETFRRWLEVTTREIDELTGTTVAVDVDSEFHTDADVEDDAVISSKNIRAPIPQVGVLDLVESFTSLRQEVKLQTKGSRSLQESAQTSVNALQAAIDQFRSVAPREADAARTAGRSFVTSLADLFEAFERGRIALEKSRERLAAESDKILALVDQEFAAMPGWKRWLCGAVCNNVRSSLTQRIESTQKPMLDSLLSGFGLIQQRLNRALQSHGVQRIDTVGRSVDVNQMTVVELVKDSGETQGIVLEEVRAGFVWNGELIRFAEVKVAG